MNMQELRQIIYKGEKVDIECKEAESNVPRSVYESYSAFANTKGGYIIFGVKEDKKKTLPEERFMIQGIQNSKKQVEDFWNTINSSKVNRNILKDEDVLTVEESGVSLIVIKVPRADYKIRPIYVGENPYKGTFKRNNEGDYHATEHEIRGMIRDQNPDGNDGMILEYYTMDDIDKETLRKYRQIFEIRNDGHVWNALDDKSFLEKLGGYRKDRREDKEGLTLAGLMMFGDGLAIRNEFDNIFMDYRNESEITMDIRWNDRITYDGTWENNLFNFFTKVTPKLTEDLKKPFKLEGIQRIDETSVHKAVREAFVNLIIHADYLMDAGVLKVIKKSNGFGDNAGSGFPSILATWEEEGWVQPELIEDTALNQVTLHLKMIPEHGEQSTKKTAEKSAESAEKSAETQGTSLSERQKQILACMELEVLYKTEEIAEKIGLKGPRTRQLLNELVAMGRLTCTAATKNRRYIRIE